METETIKAAIREGNTSLGIELGSTRIKSVLLGPDHLPLASGSNTWKNEYQNGLWTYALEDAWSGLQKSYAALCGEVERTYQLPLKTVGVIGISAMMHGYLPFDQTGALLTPFRTWRNTNAGRAAQALTELFGFNIPMRWSIAQLYQSMLDGEDHVDKIASLTTLSGYVHWRLSGRRVLGVGDASGMFPIDSERFDFNRNMLEKFRKQVVSRGYRWDVSQILPQVLLAGEDAGCLTEEGARLIDPSGTLRPGNLMSPPEGDAGTGMVATNSVAARTGNVSAGTSIFAMVVLEQQLSRVYPEIDMVTTPGGKPVAMVHCNNGTSEMDAWAGIFLEFSRMMDFPLEPNVLFSKLYQKSLEADRNAGGIMVCNFLAGEPIVGFDQGRPFVVRSPEAPFTLANFLRAQLYSIMASLVIGMRVLRQEQVKIDRLTGHGGLFKTPGVGQRYLAAATNSPVFTTETAGEGGPYGMALLAAYRREHQPGETLEEFLREKVFNCGKENLIEPDAKDVKGFQDFLNRYLDALSIEKAAIQAV